MVRCTLSSRSQPSSLNSGTLPPLWYKRSSLAVRDIAAKDAVAQQAEAAEVRKPWPLREPCHHRQVQRRRQAGHGQVDVDHLLQFAAAQRVPVPAARVLPQKGLKPAPVEADGNDNGVIRDALAFFHAQLSGDRSQLSEKRVRVYVRGAEVWREYDRWPPREAQPERYYLQPGAALSPQLPAASEHDRYSYDPEHPTPALGGPSLTFDSAIVDNRPLESRSDVLTYTSAVLASDLEITGPVHAELWVSSDRETCDFFVRLCEVHADGRSKNVCDGLARIRFPELPAAVGGAHQVQVALWPTAHRFRKGHRLRVLIASGAYPRWSINPGSIAPLTANPRAVAQHQQIHHAPDQPSAIVLPVIGR